MSYRKEFPDFNLDVIIPEGFSDSSWKNDICPSWINMEHNIKLFIEYLEPEKREQEEMDRFYLVWYSNVYCDPDTGDKDFEPGSGDIELSTESYTEVLETIDKWIKF